jgi:hypothetical protein
VLEKLFRPFFLRVARRCSTFRALQAGHLHAYLLYIFTVTILLLIWMAQ